ncbi:MAG TPA: helix-turn-helix transcriptional regulator [Longimicrobium sp.]|nr:helix-turn-helix transcriptional regulator [Longimicrobium sp.]
MKIKEAEPVEANLIEHVTPADGNIFADLGFPPEEAENLKVRSSLMIEIIRMVRERGVKQRQAAELFGVSQPRISELMHCRIDEFSIDSLINMLAHAGMTVDVSIRNAA